MNRRVVLDTSVLVSAALHVGSKPHQALFQALATCDVCGSVETLAELDLVLLREKFNVYLDRESRVEFVALIRRHARLFSVENADLAALEPACRDAKDNKFLALALAADADALICSDDDLLVMHPWRGIAIVTPAEFLSRSAGG